MTLSCDASQYELGAVVSNKTESGLGKPIAFTLRILAPAEKNYSQLEKEALAIVFAVKKFHTYLYVKICAPRLALSRAKGKVEEEREVKC